MTTRRGFLSGLLKGSVAGAAAVGLPITKTMAEEKSSTAFNFMCHCNQSLIAEVPKNVGDCVALTCNCGRLWNMEWAGDHFKTTLYDNTAAWYGNRRQEMKDI